MNPSGSLWSMIAANTIVPRAGLAMNADADRDAVHERVQREAHDRGARDVRIDDAVGVRLRAEVQVRGEHMLEEVDQQVAAEDVQRRGLRRPL